jgi:glycosyltransferase involved in cell wall biosynthesis
LNSAPLVSIVIPAFNPRFFSVALQSALNQSHEHLEIIVTDDCPGDEIKQIVESLPVPESIALRYVRNAQRLGFQQNLLSAVKLAQGEFIKVLCDDDRLFPQSISAQAQVLTEHADVNLVLAQRFLSDANNFVLPARLINCQLANADTLFNGGDMLALIHGSPVNIFGNFSSSLMRTADLQALLPVLTEAGTGFQALLDFALFICLMRRGNLVMLRSVMSVERLAPERLSKQPDMLKAASQELKWLQEMLVARGSEDAPATGWVRSIALSRIVRDQPHKWEELALLRALGNLRTSLQVRVGSESTSYEEFYADWLAARRFSETELRLMPNKIARWPSQPRIAVIITDTDNDPAGVRLTLEGIEQQLYAPQTVALLSARQPAAEEGVQYFELAAHWSQQLNEVLDTMPQVDWVYLLRAGDRLVESALLVLAERIANSPAIQCVYSDESALVDEVSQEPVFKPDFNLDLMRSYPYVGRTLAFARQAVRGNSGFDPAHGELAPHDLLWRLVETQGPQVIEHIAEIQVASSFSFAQWLSLPQIIEGNRQLLGAHLDRIGLDYRVRSGDLPLINRVEYASTYEPLVSIVVSAGSRLSSLQRCVETLIENTAYTRYEILIVDNGNSDPDMAQWLEAMGQMASDMLRVLSFDAVEPGDAALKNHAARQSRGEYLLFLSPDSVFINAQWLDELLNHARRPEVAVVGGRLISPQGTIIHAGLIAGMGGSAASPFVGDSASARGYMQRLQVTQNWSAVSADCLMVRKEVFDSVGEFDAESLALSLHDIDLCLRIGKQGYLVVGTPYSSVVLAAAPNATTTRQLVERREAENETFYRRWIAVIARDPAYNPNLSLGISSFSLHPGLKVGWSPFCSRALPSILILPINNTAVGHYRVIQPLAELEAAGRVVGRIMFDSPSLIDVQRMDPDVIVLQCRYGDASPPYIASLKKYSRALRIFELDDYVVKAPEKNVHARNKPVNTEQMLREGIALCDRVVVTSQALKEALSSMHHDIRVVPNMLAPHLWLGLTSRRGTSRRPRVGWGGGTSHTGDLEIIADVVRELADQVEWVFFGMCPDALKPYVHEFHPAVDLQNYPAKLASLNLDLALAPLEFHIFNDCKSNLRLLEYGACGYPVICTDTEAYRGFLPCTKVKNNTTQEWLDAIRMHLADPEASYRMGDQLREAVLQNFMLSGDNLKHWEWGWLPD